MRRPYVKKMLKATLAAGMIGIIFSPSAKAQMSNNPWGFQPQNRASVAALIRQVEKEKSGASAVTQIATPSYTSLICGGNSTPTASGNTTCVILNNSAGQIDVGQEAHGDQTATSDTTTTTSSDTDDVLAMLQENPAQ